MIFNCDGIMCNIVTLKTIFDYLSELVQNVKLFSCFVWLIYYLTERVFGNIG